MSMDKTVKKSRPKPNAITRKEEEILAAVSELHFVTRKGIARLLYPPGSYTHAGEALRRLSGGAGLQKRYLSHFGLLPNAPGNFERVYSLTRRGAALLRGLGLQADWWYSPRSASRYSYSFLLHQISLGKFLIALRAFVRDHDGYSIIETKSCYQMERQPPKLPFVEDGRAGASAVIPDAWAHIELPDGRKSALWIEIDNGSESKARFQSLVLDRINLVRDKGYEKYFATPSFLCCYLAVGPTTDYRLGRLRALRRWTAEVLAKQKLDWGSVFRFSTIDECIFDSHMHFTDPVWTSADSDTLVSLFPPTHEQEEDDGPLTTSDCYR
jgi:Replication-relaxation